MGPRELRACRVWDRLRYYKRQQLATPLPEIFTDKTSFLIDGQNDVDGQDDVEKAKEEDAVTPFFPPSRCLDNRWVRENFERVVYGTVCATTRGSSWPPPYPRSLRTRPAS